MSPYLVVYAHPNHQGHSGYLLKEVQKIWQEKGIEADVIDLYAIGYDPVLKDSELYSAGRKEISEQNKEFQEKIKAAKYLLFIYPTWWQNMPAILKGFLDRVFTSGFGFTYKNKLPVKLLKGKKAAVFTSTGGPGVYNRFFTHYSSLRVLSKHLLNFCGISTREFILGRAFKLEGQERKLESIAKKIVDYLK